MGGSKLDYTRRAAGSAVNLLRESDRCGLVVYDDEILSLSPCAHVDGAHRPRLLEAINHMFARGSTNLFGGWLAGAEELSRLEEARVRRVLLMTDGLANVGVTDRAEILHHVRELAARGVGTTAFGVGLDFDEVLVSGMAEAGNGHFYYIERPEQIPDFLSSELGELVTIAARSATLSVAAGGISVSNLNGLPMLGALYQLGDLSEGAIVDVCFALDLPAHTASPLAIEVTLGWQDPNDSRARSSSKVVVVEMASEERCREETPNREALLQTAKARVALARTDALSFNKIADYGLASSRALAAVADLRAMAVDLPEAGEMADELTEEEHRLAAPMSAMASKKALYDSYKMRRSRVDP
jgi:Ca-activated chloride channel family protein